MEVPPNQDSQSGSISPTETHTPPKPKNHHFALIGIAIIAIVAVIGIFIGVKKTEPPSSKLVYLGPTPTPTSESWKYYTNDQTHVSFRYPAELIMTNLSFNQTIRVDFSAPRQIAEYGNAPVFEFAAVPIIASRIDTTNGFETPKVLETILNSNKGDKLFTDIQHMKATVINVDMIDDHKAVTVDVQPFEGNNDHVVVIKKNNMYYILSGYYKTNQGLDILAKILSSFKFTDQNQTVDTSNWKTYTDKDNIFSVEYPPTWKLSTSDSFSSLHNSANGKKDVILNGPEGVFSYTWQDQFGGACGDGYTSMQLGNITVNTCHGIGIPKKGVEGWEIDKVIDSKIPLGFHIEATANSPISANRETILSIFSTFKFNQPLR